MAWRALWGNSKVEVFDDGSETPMMGIASHHAGLPQRTTAS
jgi:hypothetical protein